MTAIVWDFAAIKAALNKLTGKTASGREFDQGGVLKIGQPPPRALPPIKSVQPLPVNLLGNCRCVVVPISSRLHEADHAGMVDMTGHDFKPLVLSDRWDALDRRSIGRDPRPRHPSGPFSIGMDMASGPDKSVGVVLRDGEVIALLPISPQAGGRSPWLPPKLTAHPVDFPCADCDGSGWVMSSRQPPPQFDECPTCYNPDDLPSP